MRFGIHSNAITALAVCSIALFCSCRSKPDASNNAELRARAEAGRASFFNDACWRCHSLGDEELPGTQDFANAGPDLSTVGDRLDMAAIRQSIVDPNAVIAELDTDHTDENGKSKMPSFADSLPAETIYNLAAFLSGNKAGKSADRNTIVVTRENFKKEVSEADILVLLDFWAEWCVPCHEIDPVLEKLAPEYRGRVKICKINVDDNPDLVADYVPDNIFPCLILMKNGQLLDRQYGTDPTMAIEPFFRKWFADHLIGGS